MTPEVAMTWVNALRSGQFKQGYGVLYNSEECTYCALGVLSRIFPSLVVLTHNNLVLAGYHNIGLNDDAGYLPKLGRNIIDLNDMDLLTFDEIADIIQIYYVETKELD